LKLLADENVDRPIAARLRAEGHTVVYVLELAPSVPDPEVVSLAARESALLLTADKDFGELIFRQRRTAHGVILIRLSGLSADLKAALVATALREHAAELPGSFAVIAPGGVRIRKSVVR
jgi:predicted nuclease of predicted toxin-antitoxin system